MVEVAELFPGGSIPDREWVLSQAIPFDPVGLRAKLPDERMWPGELDAMPAGTGAKKLITRRDVFAIAERAAEEGSQWSGAQLHIACVAWGTSPGLTLSRALRPMSEPEVVVNLAKALELVRTDGALSAYGALHRGGRLKTRNLAAGFYTKLLYFGGYDAKPLLVRPLIYDSNVVARLKKLTNGRWVVDGPSSMYGNFLDLAADWARDLDSEPDVIERALFGR